MLSFIIRYVFLSHFLWLNEIKKKDTLRILTSSKLIYSSADPATVIWDITVSHFERIK